MGANPFPLFEFFFIGLLFSLGSPVFSAETKGTGECPSGFPGNKKSSHAQTRPRQGDSFEYVFDSSLVEQMGYVFKNPDMRTITGFYFGKSKHQRTVYYWNGKPLDFLGDAVFNLSVADILLRLYSHNKNSSGKFRLLISNDFLADIAAHFNIGRDIYLDKYSSDSKLHNELSKASRKEFADLLEALVGIVYLDGGYIEARKFVVRLIKETLKEYKDEEHKNLLEIDSDIHFSGTKQTAFPNISSHDFFLKRQLELLGIHIFRLHAIDILMEQYPKGKNFNKKRNTLISSIQLSILNKLDSDHRLRNSEIQKGKQSINAKKAFHFFLGAVYVEEGLERTRALVAHVIEVINNENIATETHKKNIATESSENLLYQFTQNEFQTTPEYKLIEEAGSGNKKSIIIGVWVNEELLRLGQGKTKEIATEAAATAALKALGVFN